MLIVEVDAEFERLLSWGLCNNYEEGAVKPKGAAPWKITALSLAESPPRDLQIIAYK